MLEKSSEKMTAQMQTNYMKEITELKEKYMLMMETEKKRYETEKKSSEEHYQKQVILLYKLF